MSSPFDTCPAVTGRASRSDGLFRLLVVWVFKPKNSFLFSIFPSSGVLSLSLSPFFSGEFLRF